MFKSYSDTGKLIGRKITGTTSNATAIVENISRFQVGSDLISEFLLNEESITGTFAVVKLYKVLLVIQTTCLLKQLLQVYLEHLQFKMTVHYFNKMIMLF